MIAYYTLNIFAIFYKTSRDSTKIWYNYPKTHVLVNDKR